jgi:hypothetical protein
MAPDPAPAARVIRIVRRQGQDGVEMIREYDDRVDLERAFAPRRAECRTQRDDVVDKCG